MGSYSIACIKLRDYFFLEDTYYDIHTTFFTTGVCGLKIINLEEWITFWSSTFLQPVVTWASWLIILPSMLIPLIVCLCSRNREILSPGCPFPAGVPYSVLLQSAKLFHRSVISGDVKGLSDFKYVFLCCAFCAAMEGHAMDMQRTCSWSAFLKLRMILKAIEIL